MADLRSRWFKLMRIDEAELTGDVNTDNERFPGIWIAYACDSYACYMQEINDYVVPEIREELKKYRGTERKFNAAVQLIAMNYAYTLIGQDELLARVLGLPTEFYTASQEELFLVVMYGTAENKYNYTAYLGVERDVTAYHAGILNDNGGQHKRNALNNAAFTNGVGLTEVIYNENPCVITQINTGRTQKLERFTVLGVQYESVKKFERIKKNTFEWYQYETFEREFEIGGVYIDFGRMRRTHKPMAYAAIANKINRLNALTTNYPPVALYVGFTEVMEPIIDRPHGNIQYMHDITDNNFEEDMYCVERVLRKAGHEVCIGETCTLRELRRICEERRIGIVVYDVMGNEIISTGDRKIMCMSSNGHLYPLNASDYKYLFTEQTKQRTLCTAVMYRTCKACGMKYMRDNELHAYKCAAEIKEPDYSKDGVYVTRKSLSEIVEQFISRGMIPRINKRLDKISFGGIVVYRKEEPLTLARQMMYDTSCVMSLGSVLLSGMQYYSTLNEDLIAQFSGAVPYGLSWTRKEGTYKSIDIRRCYTRAMCERLPVFNACDTINVFNGTIHDYAFYYSSAFEMGPIRMAEGWYCGTLMKKISGEILYQMVPSKTVSFKEMIKRIYSFEDCGQQKELVNCLVGSFRGVMRRSKRMPVIVNDAQDSAELYKTCRLIRQVGQYKIYQKSDMIEKIYHTVPIYCHVVQQGYAMLYDLMNMVGMENVMAVKTDAVYYTGTVNINPGKTFLGAQYREQEEQEVFEVGHRNTSFGVRPSVRTWEINNVAVEDIGHNSCFVTGMPGSGKSFIMRQLVTENSVCLTFQNNVARNMCGAAKTFHKFLCMAEGETDIKRCPLHKFATVDRIIIDEFQQTPINIINVLLSIKKCYPAIQFLCFGDYDQFIAIDNDGVEYSNNETVASLYDFNVCRLTGNKRIQNVDYVHALENKDFNKAMQMCTYEGETMYNVAFYNKTVDRINNEWLAKKLDYILLLCKETNGEFVKGCHYIVRNGRITLDTTFHEAGPEYNTWDMSYFAYGWCFTAHKTIGLTISAPYTIHLDNNDARFKYVALSRCTNPEFVRLADKQSL